MFENREEAVRELDAADIEALAVGAWILGTGGGGNPYQSLINVRRLYAEGSRVNLIDPDALDDDDLVAVVSTQGAPLVVQERLQNSRVAARAVQAMEEHLGRRFRAVMGIEVGGANALQPIMVAAHLGIPVVDADAMGRAYPEAQMTTFAVGQLDPSPLSSVDPRGNEVVITKVASWEWMERVSRKICTEFGSVAATCKAPRTGREVKDWAVLRTTTRAIRLGAAVLDANRAHADPIRAILSFEQGKMIFSGKVVEVERRTTEGFLRGVAHIGGFEAYSGQHLKVDFQNEWIVAWQDGVPLISTPDLICVLDSDTGEALGSEVIRYGQRVTVIALPSCDLFMSEAGLRHVGPEAFGYSFKFRSVFQS